MYERILAGLAWKWGFWFKLFGYGLHFEYKNYCIGGPELVIKLLKPERS
jgi:hypothetical protein